MPHREDTYVRVDTDLLNDAVLPQHRGLHRALRAACSAVELYPEANTPLSAATDWAECVASDSALMNLPHASRVCMIFVDGMGAYQLRERLGHIPTLRSLGVDNDRAMITTIAPSTTAAALTALSTGLLPGRTGMLSYALRYGKKSQLFNLIQFKDSPIPPSEWQTQLTIFERLGESAAQTVLIEDQKYKDSGLTKAAWRGAPTRFARRLHERVDIAVDELHKGKKLVYLYWGNLDHCGHKYGLDSSKWLNELEMVDAAVREVMVRAPRDTLIIVTADHGMVEDAQKIDLADTPELDAGVRAVAGEERAIHLYTDDPERVAARWSEYFGEDAWVLTKADIEHTGLFGELTERSRAAMGDVIAFARKRVGFVDSRVLSESAMAMRGVHGSLTAEEMYVPWLVHIT